MADSEDHREKNILLAKNLNAVKIDLRNKKKDLLKFQSRLRLEQQRNSKLETDQATFVNQINGLKIQLEDAFLKNTFNYIQLSKQFDQMHENSIQKFGGSILGSLNVVDSSSVSSNTSLFAKIKTIIEANESNTSLTNASSTSSANSVAGPSSSLNESTNSRLSLSFNSFAMGIDSVELKCSQLDSTFVMDAESVETELNQTFLTDNDENQEPPAEANHSNVTVRKGRKMMNDEQSQVSTRSNQNRSRGQKKTQMATDLSDTTNLALRRGCRSVKRIDYNERSFRQHK